MHQSRVSMLQGMPIFGGVSEKTLDLLINKASIIEVEKDQYFFQEGDLDNSIYILEHGPVSIYRTCQERLYMLRSLETGDCFGEMALMDCKPRSAAVQALEDCQAIQIKAAQLAELYGLDHEQYLMIYMNLGREVCRRLSEADQRLFINRFSLDAGDQSQTDQAQCHQQ
ncbi:MAG: Crp/Fnr family transcriptional regulator [Candidatus Thiodiazotropha taylori]|nr:Crp/Fnr family transcriptional regulator [Candidatus Thiodiazotropha taylori]MCW4251850.1 Crp/Fnr family transcriptional regulator [Candidatus Thiodiazotropha taylori]